MSNKKLLLLCFFTSLPFSPFLVGAIDVITPTQPLGLNQTIVSAGEVFELGFFSPGRSRWYVGIWYKNIPVRTYVWVANRDNPLRSSSGWLRIGTDGNLVLVDRLEMTVWSSNQSAVGNSVAQLLDSGNFVIRRRDDVDPGNYLWQSFDYPTDTLLPGMKLGWDSKTGLNRFLRSWRSEVDPSSGDSAFKLDIGGLPEVYLTRREIKAYRSGPWNGVRFSGVPEMKSSNTFTFSFAMNKDEIYYSFQVHSSSLYSRLTVNYSGDLQRYTWIDTRKQWNLFWYAPADQCDGYKECGDYGMCNTNDSPVCECVRGFQPRNPSAWNLRDGSDGCVRRTRLDCPNDGFFKLGNMKLPDTSVAFADKNMSIADCDSACRRNCSCTAYANFDIIDGGSGCVIWTTELLDMRQFAVAGGGQDMYVRLAASDLEQIGRSGSSEKGSGKSKLTIIKVTAIAVGVPILILGLGLCLLWKRRTPENRTDHKSINERSQDFLLNEAVIPSKRDYSGETTTDELELPLFDFTTIAMATDNFSDSNKLGQGGFGCVYKGMLEEGQYIAVKRLSKNSGQGIEEFKNEVRLIARVQHRNLVRLLGCCIDMEEKILVYEYMEHKSLDSILFNKERSSLLSWERRFNIVCGIARGLLYLHQDSRFRIIHRDLKASNILLDGEMNPKISDFGMARIFGGDQTEANTKKVVGTYGYMAPEYAMDGLFSMKSDVFSFGVLVLEIVSGKKNRGFYYTNNNLNLLGHAWKLWREGRSLELLDSSIGESYNPSEVMRCIQVGLLCVQEHAEDRPKMSTVLLTISSENSTLPQPKHPGFCLGRKPDLDSSSSKQEESCTVNQVTVTMLDGR